ncbi:hypothetical protein [Streptomyces sp. NPDC014006]|uniref:hypothetical protein n=1 Tax=Streptomyces sp. NPDC014006 TaxID=3364870 RepID=UPI0036FEB9CA
MYQCEHELTVVERFTATSAPSAFDRELLGYARYRESRKGFVSRVTAALTGRPGGYVHLEQWTGLDSLLRVVHQNAAALSGAHGLAATLRTESHLLVSVGRMVSSGTPAEAALLVLVRARVTDDPERFETDFGALVGQCVGEETFGGSDLLRSVTDACAYTGVMWWQDAAACERVRSGAAYRDRRERLTATATVVEETARPLSPV